MSDLTPKMWDALKAIQTKRAAWVSTKSNLDDSEASVHWRTAEALEQIGFVRIDDGDIFITAKAFIFITAKAFTNRNDIDELTIHKSSMQQHNSRRKE